MIISFKCQVIYDTNYRRLTIKYADEPTPPGERKIFFPVTDHDFINEWFKDVRIEQLEMLNNAQS